MRELVLLDTSALLALRDDEPGAQLVAALLVDSAKGPAPSCLACFMSRMEVLYRVWKDEGNTAVTWPMNNCWRCRFAGLRPPMPC